MNVYLNEITGMADGLVTLYFSKRTWTREKEENIRRAWKEVNKPDTLEGRFWKDGDLHFMNHFVNMRGCILLCLISSLFL